MDNDPIQLHYEVQGPSDGFPTLLLHGFASNSNLNWVKSGWVRRLHEMGRRVVLMDQRGHGQSAKPHSAKPYDRRLMASDCCRLLDHLGIDRFDCVAYSMGARVALQLLAEGQGRCRRAALLGLAHFGPSQQATQLTARLLDSAHANAATDELYHFAVTVPGNDVVALAYCLEGRHPPLDSVLGKVTAEVLVVAGERDPLRLEAQGIATAMSTAHYLEVAGLTHGNLFVASSVQNRVVQFLVDGSLACDLGSPRQIDPTVS